MFCATLPLTKLHRIGIATPNDGYQVQVQILIDGSDSQVATTAMNAANLLGLNLSIKLAQDKDCALKIVRIFAPQTHVERCPRWHRGSGIQVLVLPA